MKQVNWYPHEFYFKAIRGGGTEIIPKKAEKPKRKKKKETKDEVQAD